MHYPGLIWSKFLLKDTNTKARSQTLEKHFHTDFTWKRINSIYCISYEHKLFVMVWESVQQEPDLLSSLQRIPEENLGNSRLVLYRLNGQDKRFQLQKLTKMVFSCTNRLLCLVCIHVFVPQCRQQSWWCSYNLCSSSAGCRFLLHFPPDGVYESHTLCCTKKTDKTKS